MKHILIFLHWFAASAGLVLGAGIGAIVLYEIADLIWDFDASDPYDMLLDLVVNFGRLIG